MQKAILVILLPVIAIAQALPLQKTDDAIVFGDKDLQVVFSPRDGSIRELERNGVMVAVAQPNALWMNIKGEDGAWLPEDSTWKLQDAVQTADDTLRLDVVNGNWSVHVFTQLFPEKGQLRRWFEIAWTGDKPSKIRHFQQRWFRIPMAEGMFYNLPANRTTSEEVSFQNLTDHAVAELSADPNLITSFDTGEKTFATPAFSDGMMIVRTDNSLYCVKKK